MDFQKSKTLLDKISALFKNISGDPRNISSIERDLMKSYVLQFYESITEITTISSAMAPPAPPIVEQKPVEPKITLRRPEPLAPPPPIVEVKPIEPPPPIAPKQEVVSPPPPIVEKPVEKKVEPPVPVPIPPIIEAPTPPPVQPVEFVDTIADPEMEELFSFKSATELSEKLSQLPISDINKAMGINERISTQKELFAGDVSAFEATVNTLNQMRSYDEAKRYLINNVAVKYNWLGKDKKAKAKEFIKLIKRKY